MNYNVQEKWRNQKTTIKKQEKEEEEASTKIGKTGKLIAYISTRVCKIYQYNVQCYVKVK